MDHLHDSLSQELNTAPRSRANTRVRRIPRDESTGDDSYSKVRPITTGVIDVKYSSSHFRNHTDHFVDSTTTNDPSRVRPRAPIVGRRKGSGTVNSAAAPTAATQPIKKISTSRNKSNNISEKWDSLQKFSQNNQGRSLADEDVSSLNSSNGGGIHFVNVNNVNNFSSSDRRSKSTIINSPGSDPDSHLTDSKKSLTGASTHVRSNSKKVASASNERIFSKARDPIETKSGKLKSTDSTAFTIPELPAGKQLIINILSTW
jgi:hypothetical protein